MNLRERVRLFAQGWREAMDSNGQIFDGSPLSPRSRAYDAGRRWRLWIARAR